MSVSQCVPNVSFQVSIRCALYAYDVGDSANYMSLGKVCLQNKEIGRAAFTFPTFWRTVVELLGTHLKQA